MVGNREKPPLYIPALLEGILFCVAGLLLFAMKLSGRYLSYVTPRMGPYLLGTGVCLFIWGSLKWFEIWRPRYQYHPKRIYILLILSFLFLFRQPSKDLTQWKGWSQGEPKKVGEAKGRDTRLKKEAVDRRSSTEVPDITEPEGRLEEIQEIHVQEKDFYQWLLRFSYFPEEYQGYRVKIHGKTYQNSDFQEGQFAITRMVMTCCVADAQPAGLICEMEEGKEVVLDQWVWVVGRFRFQEEEGMKLEVESIEVAEPASQEYLYPY